MGKSHLWFFCAVSQQYCVGNTFAVEVNIRFFYDADLVELSCHVVLFQKTARVKSGLSCIDKSGVFPDY
jgi:hypothetical protein